MKKWLQQFPSIRTQPRLWVENLWLLKSIEPLAFVRTVKLQPGLNVVWAQEPSSSDGTSLSSAGHGVGKTSLCLLLRYCLGDDAPSITSLREKAAAEFPKGGVAAKVHIDGEAWLVFRPYGGYSQSRAGIGGELESLFAGQLSGDFSAYTQALHNAFIAKLPAPTLPGSSQVLEWRQLLAWCIRDQKTRFDGFFHWRDGDGLGFRRSRQDPPLFVKAILGLLDAATDKLIRDVNEAELKLNSLEQQRLELEREPVQGLAYVDKRLRTVLNVGGDLPIFASITNSSLQSLVDAELGSAMQFELTWESQVDSAENELAPLLVHQAELRRETTIRAKEREMAQALLESNEAEYSRLRNEINELQGLAGQKCRHGQVDFSDCSHIKSRIQTPSLPARINQNDADAERYKRKIELDSAINDERDAESALGVHESLVKERHAVIRRLQMKIATSAAERQQFTSLWEDLQSRVTARAEGKDSTALVEVRDQHEEWIQELNRRAAALLKRNQESSQRTETLKKLTQVIAARILGEQGHARFNPDSDSHPFEIPVGGEAYQVLEVLLGDIVCLIDSASSAVTHHPGFVIHDCPREADMSERLYREFLLTAAEAANELSTDQCAPFQYIVTTTSAPPLELQNSDYLALLLHPGVDEDLLFKRRFQPPLPGLFS